MQLNTYLQDKLSRPPKRITTKLLYLPLVENHNALTSTTKLERTTSESSKPFILGLIHDDVRSAAKIDWHYALYTRDQVRQAFLSLLC